MKMHWPATVGRAAGTHAGMRPLHHISFGVANLAQAGRFYDAALAALGLRRVLEDDEAIGYGFNDGEDLPCLKLRPDATAPCPGFHLAYSAGPRGGAGLPRRRAGPWRP
ncbi:MAG: hypothetical protein ACK4PH_23770 [Aquincola tertiaricarbonis]